MIFNISKFRLWHISNPQWWFNLKAWGPTKMDDPSKSILNWNLVKSRLPISVDKSLWNVAKSMEVWLPHAVPLQWRHNGRDSVSNHQPHDCLLNLLFRRRSKKTSTLRVTGLCSVNSPLTGEIPAQMARNTENVSFWWRHHEYFRRMRRLGSQIFRTDYLYWVAPGPISRWWRWS